jgi:hypothetical protein
MGPPSRTRPRGSTSASGARRNWVWANGNHFDYYDSHAEIDNAVANVTRFFRTHLSDERLA